MTDSFKNEQDRPDNADDVGRLIAAAGAREAVQSDRLENARERVGKHWQGIVTDRQRSKRRLQTRWYAIAASVAVVSIATMLYSQFNKNAPGVMPASIDRVVGQVHIGGAPAVQGGSVAADTLIETGPAGRIAVRMPNGQSLRVDTGSTLFVHSPEHVSLQAGAVYIDTDSIAEPPPIRVTTSLGTARDVGTQFQVRLLEDTLSVGVRDGMVEVARSGGQKLTVDRGRSIVLDSEGQKSERELRPDDASWDWVATVVPSFDIQGETLERYLEWYANERGLQLRWDSPASKANAKITELDASIDGMSLVEGFETVQKITDFEYRVDGESLWIKVE